MRKFATPFVVAALTSILAQPLSASCSPVSGQPGWVVCTVCSTNPATGIMECCATSFYGGTEVGDPICQYYPS